MSNRQLQENLRKLLGLNNRNEKQANRPRVLGGSSVAKMPASEKAPDICAPPSAMLRFNDKGAPTAKSARIIDGLFDVNTGRQVRIFLDPSAFICDNVTTSSEYIWYKLQIKDKLETRRKEVLYSERDTPYYENNRWWTWHEAFGCFSMPEAQDNPVLIRDVLDQYNVLSRMGLNTPVFFSTVPIKHQLIDTDKEKYKKAVTEIADYFKNNIDGYTGKYVAQEVSKLKTNTFVMDTQYGWPPSIDKMFDGFKSYLNFNLSRNADGFCKWGSKANNLFYNSFETFNSAGWRWYWGVSPSDSVNFDSRWKFADDLAYGAAYILQQRNQKMQESGKLQPLDNWYINSYEDAKKGTQFADMSVSMYYRPRYKEDGETPTTDDDYQLLGTIDPQGVEYLWNIDVWPDDAIIEMRFNPAIGKFKPLHPLNSDLLPNNLNNLSGLNLQDEKGNFYSITLSNTGILLSSVTAGKSWIVSDEDYILAEKQESTI